MKRTYAAHYQVNYRLYFILVQRILRTWFFVLHLFASMDIVLITLNKYSLDLQLSSLDVIRDM
jgi:hypothetical protein